MPKPPVDPGYFDKVNFVIDSWADPCDAPWYLYAETAGPAALEAFITLISFGWGDVIRGYARPKGLDRRRTSKRKGKWRKFTPRFPEIGNLIGRNIPTSDIAKATKWSCFGKTLWRIDARIQGVLLVWLLVDVTIDFAYNWTSLLYSTQVCRDQARGRFSYRKDGDTTYFGGDWRTQEFPTEDYEIAPPEWFNSFGISGPKGCTVATCANARMISFPPRASSFNMRLINPLTGEVYSESGDSPASTDPDTQCVQFARLGPGETFALQIKTDADFVITNTAAVTAVEAG